jgi:glycosyltransferase involved in cell wall biosynthesis
MKEIAIITSYFPPEPGAASNRIHHLAEGLQHLDYKVSVITPLPNYPTGRIFEGYRSRFKQVSEENGVIIHRLWIFASNSKNKFFRLFAMLSYSFSLIWFFLWNKLPKTVIVQSPPLLVAFTCMLFLRSKKRKLILNVSDLWPIAGLELGAFKKNFSYRILERIEKFNYANADLAMGQSMEILEHIGSICPKKALFLYRNFPNFKLPELPKQHSETQKLSIVYAGLLGIAQGIYSMCEQLDFEGIELHIYGSGAEQSKLEAFIADHDYLPIVYHGQVSRQELHRVLQAYDVTVIPLLNRIYGSVPSKIFEYARLGLPMLYFGGGEGETLIKKHELGWVAKAGNYAHLNTVISTIQKEQITGQMRTEIQETARIHFDFDKQLLELEHVILEKSIENQESRTET